MILLISNTITTNSWFLRHPVLSNIPLEFKISLGARKAF